MDLVYNEIQKRKRLLLNITRKYLVCTLRNIHTHQTFLWFKNISIETAENVNLGINFQNSVDVALDQYNSKVFAAVTDNVSKIKAGVRNAISADGRRLIQSSCSSHRANLLIKSFVDEDLMKQIRELVRTFSEPKYDCFLRNYFGGTKLKNFPDTRFNYLRDTCNSILKNLDALRLISEEIEDIELKESVTETLSDPQFEIELNFIVDHLKPICNLINECQKPDCNVADPTQMWSTLILSSEEYDDLIEERVKKAISPVGFAAKILHNKYKGVLLNNGQRQVAFDFLEEFFDQNVINEYNYYINHLGEFQEFAAQCDNLISYWTNLRMRFKNLGDCAISLMLIPTSTAMIEGLFSKWT